MIIVFVMSQLNRTKNWIGEMESGVGVGSSCIHAIIEFARINYIREYAYETKDYQLLYSLLG